MTYEITPKIIAVLKELKDAGYTGSMEITTGMASGTVDILQGALCVQLSGFCKECLHLVEDTINGHVVAVGRYSVESEYSEIDVPTIVAIAWQYYKSYKERGYSMPGEFKELFTKYGYITEKTVIKTVIVEKD